MCMVSVYTVGQKVRVRETSVVKTFMPEVMGVVGEVRDVSEYRSPVDPLDAPVLVRFTLPDGMQTEYPFFDTEIEPVE